MQISVCECVYVCSLYFKKWAFQIGSSKLGAKKARQFEKEINRIVKLTKK